MDSKFIISANGREMTATFADNSSAAAFRDLIADAPLSVSMSDYGDFEKVGDIGHNLPTNDSRITTAPGDVILYLGSNITIYYGVNSWSFTRLGRIDGNPTRESILEVLGGGSVDVTFSLKSSSDGISNVDADSKGLNVSVAGRRLDIRGIDRNAVLSIHGADGSLVYSGSDHQPVMPSAGIYIINCEGAKVKVIVN